MAQEPFGDIPLFREIQRLLAAGSGPVNLEIARQVALAAATQGTTDPGVDPEIDRSVAEAVHSAEALLAGYTRLSSEEVVRSATIGRARWVTSTLAAWKWLLEHLGERLTAQMSQLGQMGGGEGAQMGAVLGQIVPLMLGIQTGTLVGQLAAESLGRYDWPIPRDDDGRLFFVVSNVEAVATDYGFEREAFHRWLAVRDTARHLIVSSSPWVERYLRSLLVEVVDALEIDTSDLERRLMDLQTRGPEALGEAAASDLALPIASTERHIRALQRLHAFQAAFQGYAAHAAGAVMPKIVPDAGRMDEGMTRRGLSPSVAETMLSTILGISLDRELEVSGTTFCAAVVRLEGLQSLNQVWSAPDNLPTESEIKDPFSWMERVLGRR